LVEELQMGNRVKVATAVPHENFPDYFACLDVMVLPSLTTPTWKEQFGRVLVEAMACGVPVIGSSSGAIPEVLGEAGLIFPEGDENALAEKIGLLMKEAAWRERLSRTGQERVSRLYSTSVIAERTHHFYQSLR
jgi:glycosyltransferase involved in cell wall biosynthesis